MSDKLSINQIITEVFDQLTEFCGIEYLFDSNASAIYDPDYVRSGPVLFDDSSPFSLCYAFEVIRENMCIHGRGKKRIRTVVEQNRQLIYFECQSPHISQEKIRNLNQTIDLILSGQELIAKRDSRFALHGTQKAARCLRRYGGTMRYENISNEYTVRTVISLPLHQRSAS